MHEADDAYSLIPLKMDRNLFARMALIGQFQKIDLKEVFKYPLGPLPRSLANAYGLPKKTNKAKLMQLLEKGTATVERYPKNACSIYDGMALLQRFQPPAGAAFVVLANKIFDVVTSNPSRRIDMVFDVCFDVSIKNAERAKRSSCPEGVKYKNILPACPIKSWKKFMFMSIQTNKTEVVHFLMSQWKRSEYTSKLGNKVLYITEGSKCWKLTTGSTDNVPELESRSFMPNIPMVLW